jgi:hypothetical protein
MAGHSRRRTASLPLAYVPAIHVLDGVTEQMDDEENRDLRYRIRFVIHHPDKPSGFDFVDRESV